MAPQLIAVAEKAQDISAALDKFLGPLDDQSAEITALMAECLATSSALRALDRKIGDFPYHLHYPGISNDLTTVKDSLNYTFSDFKRILGGLGRVAVVPNAEYGYVWQNLCAFFRAESGNTLRRRLEIYCNVLEDLSDTLTEGVPRDLGHFNELIFKLEELLDAQREGFVGAVDGLNVGGSVITRPTSFERRRPQDGYRPQPRPEPHPNLRGGGRANNRHPDVEDDFRGAHRPPPAPDIPGSPTTSSTFSAQSSSLNSVLSSHWLPEVFNQQRPSTPLKDTGQTSIFLAYPMPGSSTRLSEEYFKLIELPFENGDLIVRLYQRQHDGRSRFLCRTIRPARSRKDVTLPLVSLDVSRSGPFLNFTNVSEETPELWASLKFSSYERLVLFFCTFLALRSEDTKTPLKKITDFYVHKETELFAGRIVDDHYEHALRLFQDKDTGAVRLQASAQTGALKRTPIWTAFITHQILSPTWMSVSRHSSRVVHLADLQRFVFTEEYNPQRTPSGKHEFTFIGSSDAKEFVIAIKELVKREKARRKHR